MRVLCDDDDDDYDIRRPAAAWRATDDGMRVRWNCQLTSTVIVIPAWIPSVPIRQKGRTDFKYYCICSSPDGIGPLGPFDRGSPRPFWRRGLPRLARSLVAWERKCWQGAGRRAAGQGARPGPLHPWPRCPDPMTMCQRRPCPTRARVGWIRKR